MTEDKSEKLLLSYSGQSDIGMIRIENQDSFGKFPADDLDLDSEKGQLFIVADGVGGHTGGKEASSMAVNIIGDVYFNSNSSDRNELLKESIEEANYRIYKKASTSTEFLRMATTCCTLLLKEKTGTIGHVGDSRIYKIENNQIEQLTSDHTQVQEMLREGLLTSKEAENYPNKSVLVRAIGAEEKVKVDLIENIPLRNEQSFVLCSDGLGKVTEDEILKIVLENSPEISCQKLIGLANERGGKDNITVQVIKINSSQVLIPDKIPLIESKNKHKTKTEQIKQQGIEPLPTSVGGIKKKKNIIIISFIFILFVAAALFIFRNSIPFLNTTNKIEQISPAQETIDFKEIDETNSNQELVVKANKFYSEGKIESALKAYQKILDKESMHLEALNGITKIADFYFQKAEKLRNENNFREALVLYTKVKELQPDNEKINEYIIICNNQIQKRKTESVEIVKLKDNAPIIKENKKDISVTNIVAKDWDFINSNPNQFVIEESGIEFTNSSQENKTIYTSIMYNAVVSVNVKLYNYKENSRVGIIVGYEYTPEGNENYFLFTLQNENEYVLHKISGNSTQQLLFLFPSDLRIDQEECQLKIKCSDNIISIYGEGRLLSSYENSSRITGKVGFFVDKNISAKFYNLSIRGIKADN